MKVEVAVLGSPVPNGPYGLCGRKATFEEEEGRGVSELRSCAKVDVNVLGSSSLISLIFMVSVHVKHHERRRSVVQ